MYSLAGDAFQEQMSMIFDPVTRLLVANLLFDMHILNNVSALQGYPPHKPRTRPTDLNRMNPQAKLDSTQIVTKRYVLNSRGFHVRHRKTRDPTGANSQRAPPPATLRCLVLCNRPGVDGLQHWTHPRRGAQH